MALGGIFTLEKTGRGDNYRADDIIFAMSGRCAIYTCLQDLLHMFLHTHMSQCSAVTSKRAIT